MMATNEEASPICRGKNLSWETVMLFFNYIPKEPMPKDKFNAYVEKYINSWTQTHSQIARQLAFYYEEGGICYPRFNKASTLSDLFNYMVHWAHNYFIPNPYAPSLKGKKPTSIYTHLVKCIEEGILDFDTALDSLFDIPLSSHDKVKVYLQNYSNIKFEKGIISLNDSLIDHSQIMTPTESIATDQKEYFLYYGRDSSTKLGHKNNIRTKALQQIFFGAPGTGKSHTIKKTTDKVDSKFVFRTTFHPDSDYSTFVGAYKPKIEVLPRYNQETGEQIGVEKRIVYAYTPQAFLKAYTTAWNNPGQSVFLIIEEINRGNCAQIFGDIFQLLDRGDDGESCYPIKADQDMQMFLLETFTDNASLPENIQSGEELILPSNLYIWATMNTSDQSLFPIDSAFKRRWEWKYRPIIKGRDKDGNELNWRIKADTREYDWWSFLEKINAIVGTITNSEDKKLGFFFCKPTDDVISAETFVNKVIFYLYTDVFKDFGFDNPIFKDYDSSTLEFDKFYTTNANGDTIVLADKVETFLENLKVTAVGDIVTEVEDEDGNTSSSSTRDYTKYSINGVGKYGKNILAAECVREYIKLNPEMSIEDVLANWKSLGYIVPHFVESKEEHDNRTGNSIRSVEIPCGDTFVYVEKNGYGNNGAAEKLISAVNQKGWNIKIDKV